MNKSEELFPSSPIFATMRAERDVKCVVMNSLNLNIKGESKKMSKKYDHP